MSRFSDEEIAAYLDGEGDPSLGERLEARAAEDAELRGRIEALTVDKQAIAEAFEGLLGASPHMPTEALTKAAPLSRTDVWRTPGALAAAAAACLAIGLGVGFQLASYRGDGATRNKTVQEAPLESWRDYAAAYHALYVTDTLTHVADDDAARVRELDRASRAVGLPLDGVRAPIDELQFRRAQLLGFEGRALVQVAFLSATGAPMALCLINSPDAGDSEVALETRRDMASASWSQPGLEFLLIGGRDAALTKRAAETLRRRLSAS